MHRRFTLEGPSSSSAEFGLAYYGDAIAENTMDVRDLAPSLFALGELFTRTNTILNGEHVSVSLKVRATKPGSFELVLILGQMYQSATQFLTGGFITSSVNLLALTFGASSLFGLFKRLKGQEPTEIVERADGVTLKVGDIEVHVPTAVFRCWKDDQVKRLTQAVVLPLYKTGVDMMVIRKGSKQLEVISKQDAPSFTVENLTTVDQGTENILPALTLRLVSPTFDVKAAKWRLNDGSGTDWYAIQDEVFLSEVRDNKRRFGMGDYLICRVRTVQHITEKGLKMERAVLQVLDHKKAGQQLALKGYE